MNVFLLILGILLVTLSFNETLWTTLWVDGNAAPITSRLSSLLWKLFKALIPKEQNKALSLAGPFILASSVFFWIVLLWIGWACLFYAEGDAILTSTTKNTTDFSGHLWYIAYTLFTVGNGDFSPQEDTWQVLSALVAFSGMSIVTLSITYLIQVISAVAQKRAFASQVTSIGKTAEDFVIKQWTGTDFGAIELQLNTITAQLTSLNEQHLSFPILHFYHAASSQKSMDVALAILSDALALIQLGIPKKHHPAETILSSSRESVDTFLSTLNAVFIKPAQETPPKPTLSKLSRKDVPTLSEKEFAEKLEEESKRRKLLFGLINKGAWKWPSGER